VSAPLSDGVQLAPAVYGLDGVPPDDAAEFFHEASKLHATTVARQMPGGGRLERSSDLRAATLRAGKMNRHLPRVRLPSPPALDVPLGECLSRRRSVRAFSAAPLTAVELAIVLHAAYGVTERAETESGTFALRTVPSGGALYPLELYVLAARVESVEAGLYHLDSIGAELERLPAADPAARLAAATVDPDLCARSAATVVVTAMFWRSRFKYGLRGYRFALLEAGHLMQNLLLAATALGLGALPVGGFFDRRVDELLGVDGVNESVLYAVHLGRGEA
jgi:SagB-type dehydrogenase family enzyme